MTSKFCIFSILCFLTVLNTLSYASELMVLKNAYKLPKATEEKVEKVVQEALKNLVFVEGGSFVMGDSGYLYKGNRVYWSPWVENFPVHKVTLDSFSISKYEVTWREYDIYNDLMGYKPFQMIRQHKYYRKGSFPVGNITWQQALRHGQKGK